MKKTLLSTTLILLMSAPAMAQEKKPMPTETAVGMGSGIVIGAALGGPVGAFIGAFTGALIGEKEAADEIIETQKLALADFDRTRGALARAEREAESLGARVDTLEAEKQRLEQRRIDSLLAMTVQFRSGSSEIEPHFAAQLDHLVAILKQQPEIELDLNGFADQRGEEAANLALSKARADAVQGYLIKHGIAHTRLFASGLGERNPLAKSGDYEGDFFDRRVTLNPRAVDVAERTASNR